MWLWLWMVLLTSRRFFYASSACIYPEGKQLTTELQAGLKESDAWPAEPQDAYGLEKLASEELAKHYQGDFGMQTRTARFHNIYGPFGTWKGEFAGWVLFHFPPAGV